jgi:DNA-binding response OmpR family regulator
MKILAVDDEPLIGRSLSFALAAPGRELTTADNGYAALDRLGKEGPPAYDVVITDNNMPGMTGVELVRRLRHDNFTGKIVVLSAFLDEGNRQAYSDLGVDEMVSKPFELRTLRAMIDRLANAA